MADPVKLAKGGFHPANILIMVLLLGLIAFLAWSATKKTDTENYTKGALHYETTIAPVEHAYPLCCARFEIRPDGTAIDLDRQKGQVKK